MEHVNLRANYWLLCWVIGESMTVKKIIFIILGLVFFVVFVVACLGMYKFNYLASLPGYSVDINKCFEIDPRIGCDQD